MPKLCYERKCRENPWQESDCKRDDALLSTEAESPFRYFHLHLLSGKSQLLIKYVDGNKTFK